MRMHFAGIQKNSLIDYPGKISCVLFMPGCNFDCPYCHNPNLARSKVHCLTHIDDNEIYDFLEKRKGFLQHYLLLLFQFILDLGMALLIHFSIMIRLTCFCIL